MPTRRRGAGDEILDLRDWRPGDDWRTLDWKATARADRFVVRDFEREQERRAVLVVDPRRPSGRRARTSALVEEVISRAAGAARQLAREGFALRLITPGSSVEGDAHAVERALARVVLREPEAHPFRPASLPRGAIMFRAGEGRP